MNGDQIANKCKFQIVYSEGEEEAVGWGWLQSVTVREIPNASSSQCCHQLAISKQFTENS